MSTLPALNEQTLMPKDWLQRRLIRLVHPGRLGWRPDITIGDVARFFNVDDMLVRNFEVGRVKISDRWQVRLSQFFYLLDMGLIEMRVNRSERKKTWVRLAEPKIPPCKGPMPRVDFATTKLKWD